MSRRDYHYEGWLQLRTPLMHGGDQSFGTTRLFRTQKVVCDDGTVRRIPVYSGNAVRGMLRDVAADQLLSTLNVSVPPPVFDFLTSGGSLTSGGNSIDLDLARRLQRTIPMIGLWGGGVGNQIIEGKLIFLQGMPICRETAHLLPEYCRDAPSAGLSIRQMRQMEFGTRRDDKKKEGSQPYLTAQDAARGADDVATQMLYETETLAPGTCLRFGFIATDLTEQEWVCFCAALVGWLAKPFLGGRSAAGYGEVAVPALYAARRDVKLLQDGREDAVIDLEKPLAEVSGVVDTSSRLELLAGEVVAAYEQDVRGRRDEIIQALGEVV